MQTELEQAMERIAAIVQAATMRGSPTASADATEKIRAEVEALLAASEPTA